MALKKYYMLVTNDSVELPLSPPLLDYEMAEYTGLTVANVKQRGYPSYQRKLAQFKTGITRTSSKIIVVRLDMSIEDGD